MRAAPYFLGRVATYNSDINLGGIVRVTGGTNTLTDFQERTPHHTAIVERNDGGGAITVLEQNVDGSPVVRNQLFFKSAGPTTVGNKTTTITVSGKFWFYRPQPK